MDITLLQVVFSFAVFLITWLAAVPPFKHQHKKITGVDYSIGEALSCGIFLGAALLHMLPEANEVFVNNGFHYPFAFLGAGAIFLLLLWIEHLGNHISSHAKGNRNNQGYALLSVAILSIHSLLAGAALGSTNQISTALIIILAVVAHKWASSFALAVKLTQSGQTLKVNLITFGVFSVAFPLGVWLGDAAISQTTNAYMMQAMFNSFAAGTFLYLGTLHGLTRATLINSCCNKRDFNYVIVGFIIMALVALAH